MTELANHNPEASGGVSQGSGPAQVDGNPLTELGQLVARLAEVEQGQDGEVVTRLQALFEVDEQAQPLLRKLSAGFLQSIANGSDRHFSIWPACDVFHARVISACRACREAPGVVPESMVVELAVRLVRAAGNQLKWQQLNYGPFDDRIWALLGGEFLAAVSEARSRQTVRLRSERDTVFSVEREYLRALALHCASLDQLPVELMDIADRLIHYLLDDLRIADHPIAGATHVFNPWRASPPRRLVRGIELEQGAWYFSAAGAAARMSELADMLTREVVPPALENGPAAVARVRACLEHCRAMWSEQPPARRFRRHPISGGLKVVHGLGQLAEVLADVPPAQGGRDEIVWELQNVSRKGFGAVAPETVARLIQVGSLVGICPTDGAGWQLGIIRRLQRLSDGQMVAGVENLSPKPYVVEVDDGRNPVQVVVCDPLQRGEAVRLVMPLLSLRPTAPLFVPWKGMIVKLKPLGISLPGPDFEIRAYQVL